MSFTLINRYFFSILSLLFLFSCSTNNLYENIKLNTYEVPLVENIDDEKINIINDFKSYIDDEIDSYKGIKLELDYLTKILEAEKNSINYSSFDEVNDIFENIMNSDVVSSGIKERVNKIHEFYSNK